LRQPAPRSVADSLSALEELSERINDLDQQYLHPDVVGLNAAVSHLEEIVDEAEVRQADANEDNSDDNDEDDDEDEA
jgi:hypothetical protein